MTMVEEPLGACRLSRAVRMAGYRLFRSETIGKGKLSAPEYTCDSGKTCYVGHCARITFMQMLVRPVLSRQLGRGTEGTANAHRSSYGATRHTLARPWDAGVGTPLDSPQDRAGWG